jgi:polysaccharide pyruvyl transferase WcaK-like protein
VSTRILHAATHAHNIGDGALVCGMQATLAEDLARPLSFASLDVLGCKLRRQRNMLTKAQWDQLQDDLDLVLVGGGGMIEGQLGSYLSGINFNFDLEILERSRVPWVFYALGHNQFRGSPFFHRRKLQRLLELGRTDRVLVSVRNDGSKARLERQLGPLPQLHVIPDPGLYLRTRPRALPELAPGRVNIVVQLAADRLGSRLGAGLRRRLRAITDREPIARLAKVLDHVVQKHSAHLVLCPHLVGDLALIAELVGHLPTGTTRSHCTVTHVLNGAAQAADFFEVYRQADLVVGMRGHSAICAVGQGTPFIGLGTHDKIAGFMQEVGLGDMCCDLSTNPRLDGLAELIEGVISRPEAARARVAAIRPRLRQQTATFHAEIDKLLSR